MHLHRELPSAPARPGAARAALAVALLALAACGGGGHHKASSSVGVDAVSPSSGPFIGGTTVTIRGRSFDTVGANEVTFGGRACAQIVVQDEHTLTCVTPAGTPGATVDVVVHNGRGEGSLAHAFTYASPDPATSDVNGDGIADLVVSAPGDATNGPDAGAVYVFLGSSDPAALASRSTADADCKLVGMLPGDGFGTCVCTGDVDGDHVADVVVGARGVDAIGAADAGAVYVFRGPLVAGAVMPATAAEVTLTGDASVAGDAFGTELHLADATGDGQVDLLVTAPGHDTADAPDSGCVYAFRGGAAIASANAVQATLSYDGGHTGDQVGMQIASGDLDGDGRTDLVLAASNADGFDEILLPRAGKVYVLRGSAQPASRSIATSEAVFSGEHARDHFGAALAVGDVTGDDVDDLVVGAPDHDGSDVNTGRVYVFRGGAAFASRASSLADVRLSGLPTHDSFGRALRTGDVDGDSIRDLLVGAPLADHLNSDNGRAYVFRGGAALVDGVAIDAFAILDGESSAGDLFGTSVGLLDSNGDGFADLVATSSFHGSGSGRAYLWRGGTSGLAGERVASGADVVFTGLQSGALFGTSVAQGQ